MSKAIKILHVLNAMRRGGAEMRTLELFRCLDRRQYQFHFCALSGQRGELDDEIRRLGGEVHLLRRGLVGFPRRFRGLLREHRFEVVHSQVLYFSGCILRLAAQCGTPVRVAQFQNSHDSRRSSPPRRTYRWLMRRWIDRYATDITAVSEGAMSGIWGARWNSDPRCQVIYNGVATAGFAAGPDRRGVLCEFGLPDDALLCIHAGRIAPQKNHLRLIAVFAELLKRRPQARLLIAGRGDDGSSRRLQQRIKELGVARHVTLCGERGDVPRLLMAADVLIFPSKWEGLPGVVQEAAAAGTPVVASDLPGVREIAQRLDDIRHVPLAASDRHWAEAVEAAVAKRPSARTREEALQRFAASPFAIERVAEMNRRLWLGPVRNDSMHRVCSREPSQDRIRAVTTSSR